jgi:hypothetical protein
MDGTFVKELSDRLQPEPRALRLADGRELVFRPVGDDWELLKRAAPKSLQLHTLQGLVDYLAAGIDPVEKASHVVHVLGPQTVRLEGSVEEALMGERPCLAQVTFPEGLTGFPFGQWQPAEMFVLGLQALFVPTKERDGLLTLVSSIRGGDVRETSDNGYAQEVKATKGVALVANVPVPSRVRLQPYRTFREVEQPASDFVLRLAQGPEQKPSLLLAEADGGAWRLEAVHSVGEWLRTRLASLGSTYPRVIA